MSSRFTVTPSPHRFLPANRKAQPTTHDAPTKSGAKPELRRPESDDGSNAPPAQFAHTPRFSHARLKATIEPLPPPSPPRSNFLQTLKASHRLSDDVDDGAVGYDDDEMLDDEQARARPTTEHRNVDTDEHGSWTNDLALSPKRRRLTAGEPVWAETPTFKHPQIPASCARLRQASGFAPAASLPPSTGDSIDTTISRPAFVRPQQRDDEPSEPLPEVFSPHRRGHKFVPGGIAASMQQLVLDTGQNAIQSRKGQAYLQGEIYVLQVQIEGEVDGAGPFTAVARTSAGAVFNLVLAGANGGGTSAHKLRAGATIGIRAPTWEVELERSIWTVAADWRVLS